MHSYVMNLIFGFIVSALFLLNPTIIDLINFHVYDMTEKMMHILTIIINWLMGVPVGLKLNRPLNEFLSRFFLYHIYLWNSNLEYQNIFLFSLFNLNCYVQLGSLEIIKFILPYVLNAIIFSGFLGLSSFISMLIDVLQIFTIHNFCFYIYGLRYLFLIIQVHLNIQNQ